MNAGRFSLAAAAAPLFIAGGADAVLAGLSTRLVDPNVASGMSGTWAANGYPVSALDTYRVYAQFTSVDTVFAVGDLFIGLPVMNLSTDAPTFFNATGALGNNGIQKPTDFTSTPGHAGYTSQWDSYVTVDSHMSVSLAPGLAFALGATSMGMGGLVGNSFAIDNTGWSVLPITFNTSFNPGTGFFEAVILQLTVAEGFHVWGDDIVLADEHQNNVGLSFHSIPGPGALALLVAAGLARPGRRVRPT